MKAFLASVVVLGLVAVSIGLYLLPVLIGWVRRVPDIGTVAVVNIFLGWSLVGWVIALALAFRSPRPTAHAVHLEHYSQQPPPMPAEGSAWVGGPEAPDWTDFPPPVLRRSAWPDVPGWSPWADKDDLLP